MITNKDSVKYVTNLDIAQIKQALIEMKDGFSVEWNRHKKQFIVRKKVPEIVLARLPISVRVKGRIHVTPDRAEVTLSVASTMGTRTLLLFSALTLAILLYTGRKAGVSYPAILFTFAAILGLTYLVSSVFSRYTSLAEEIRFETVNAIVRNLKLEKVKS